MADKVWKAFERRVAKFFGAVRNALSGGNSKMTRSDSLHPHLYVECKYSKRHAIVSLWKDANEKAKLENKIPVVCLGVKGQSGFWVMTHSSDLSRVALEHLKATKLANSQKKEEDDAGT